MTKIMKNKHAKPVLGLILMFVALGFVPVLLAESFYIQHVATMVLFYAVAGLAWNILCGFVGEVSLGHSVFIGVGGYTSTMLFNQFGVSPWIGMIVGILASILLGIIIGFPCFKLRGPYFTIATIAIGELLRTFIENTDQIGGLNLGGSNGFVLTHNPDVKKGMASLIKYFLANDKAPYFWLMLVFLALAIFLTYYIKHSKLGNYFIAIRSDHDAAESLGINVKKYKMIAIIISSGLIAVLGTFYAQFIRYIGPTRIFGIDLSIQIALIALIGGSGTILGPLLGASILVPLTEYLSANFSSSLPGLNLFTYGIVLILVVVFMPKGLIGFFNKRSKFIRIKMDKTDRFGGK